MTPDRPPVDPTTVAARVLAEVLGAAAHPGPLEVLQASALSWVLKTSADHSSRALVVKLVPVAEHPRVDLERTAAVMERARTAGVPVPDVLGADGTGRHDGWQFLVLNHVDGVPWREVLPRLGPDAVAAAHGQIAETVLRLQSVALEGFGELDRVGVPDGADLATALLTRARLRIRDPRALAVAEQLVDRSRRLFSAAGTPGLSHDDLHHQNVVFAPGPAGWRLAAVLDWDKAWAGPAESDLARLAFWDGMTGPGFWSVYRGARPALAGEDERWLVHQLLWCLEYDVDTERHRSDTVRLCRRLGLRPPRTAS